jgi:hypothetical protein
MAGAIPVKAETTRANSDEIHLAAEVAGLHCQLWLRHLTHQNAPREAVELSHLLGRSVSPDEAAVIALHYQGLPDFSFLLPQHWDVMDYNSRQSFNAHLMPFLNRQFHLAAPSCGTGEGEEACTANSYCGLDVTLAEQEEESHDIFVTHPKQPLLKGRIQTLLPSEDGSAATLVYHLKQDPAGWYIEEITLNNTPLMRQYHKEFAQRITREGFSGLVAWLERNRGK